MQGVIRRILRDSYQDAPPSSAGTHTGTPYFPPPIPARPIPYLVTQPNYHNGQFYPPGTIPQIPLYPTTSVQPASVQLTSTVSTDMDRTPGISTISSSTTTTTTSKCSYHTANPRMAHGGPQQGALTVFGPMSLVEFLTKNNHLLVADIKGELQTMNNQLSNLPIAEIRKDLEDTAEELNGRLEMLENQFNELREIFTRRTNQSFNVDPELLDKWDSTMLVIRRSPWNNMRFILNRVASDNITNLFQVTGPQIHCSLISKRSISMFCVK